MLIADALRTLAPFSLVAGEPVFHMVSRLAAALPGARRRAASHAAPSTAGFLPVQRCRAVAANDASIKRYWAKPGAAGRERGMRWAMSGSMADVFAELERLERLERQQSAS